MKSDHRDASIDDPQRAISITLGKVFVDLSHFCPTLESRSLFATACAAPATYTCILSLSLSLAIKHFPNKSKTHVSDG